ncbi:MAG: AAA family ATPase [Cytophagaceae bacterium]|nr:AAA family ATPase [Cytophagaceae bacterium]
MLNSLEIRNYRNLKHLTIEKLGRVNLVIGKNNTGKTSLLEILGIFFTDDEMQFIEEALRGTLTLKGTSNREEINRVNTLKSLFYNETFSFFERDYDITVQEIEEVFLSPMTIRFAKVDYHRESEFYNVFEIVGRKKDAEKRSFLLDQFLIQKGNEYKRYDIGEGKIMTYDLEPHSMRGRKENVKYIKSFNVDRIENGTLFGKINFTDKEKYVADSLKIIDSRIEQFNFIKNEKGEQAAVVKLQGVEGAKSLSQFGDGINRILTIILAMVNCENGYLLIDEFENGLHYSVQEKLWEIIFQLSEQLNIQVFATTHSNDTIRTFENVVNQDVAHPTNGVLIKLDNIEGSIEATVFEPDELKFITDNFIEAR